jgi:hypothetical protein
MSLPRAGQAAATRWWPALAATHSRRRRITFDTVKIPPSLTHFLASLGHVLDGQTTSNWTEIPGVEISIEDRGEGIVYREAGREFHLGISLDQQPLVLYTGEYWDGTYPIVLKRLEEADRAWLVPRLVAYLGSDGQPVEVKDE